MRGEKSVGRRGPRVVDPGKEVGSKGGVVVSIALVFETGQTWPHCDTPREGSADGDGVRVRTCPLAAATLLPSDTFAQLATTDKMPRVYFQIAAWELSLVTQLRS